MIKKIESLLLNTISYFHDVMKNVNLKTHATLLKMNAILTLTQITFACIWSDVIIAVTRREGTMPALIRDSSLPSLNAKLQNIAAQPRRRFSSLTIVYKKKTKYR